MDINDIIVDTPAWNWTIAVLFTLITTRSLLRRKKWALGVVRLVVLATLCFLLLEPLLDPPPLEIEPSTMVILIDESASQVVGNDSLKRKRCIKGLGSRRSTQLWKALDTTLKYLGLQNQ